MTRILSRCILPNFIFHLFFNIALFQNYDSETATFTYFMTYTISGSALRMSCARACVCAHYFTSCLFICLLFLLDDMSSADYCLVEVGHNGRYQRVVDNDEYPLALTTSPFYNTMHDIYICTYHQARNGMLH